MSKQYLLLCDESGIESLRAVFKSVQFLEVQGMNLNAENRLNLLVTPVNPPVTPVVFAPPPAQDQPVASEEVPVA